MYFDETQAVVGFVGDFLFQLVKMGTAVPVMVAHYLMLVVDPEHQPALRPACQRRLVAEGGKVLTQLFKAVIVLGFLELHPLGFGRQGQKGIELFQHL